MDEECALASYGPCNDREYYPLRITCLYCNRKVCLNHIYPIYMIRKIYHFCDECVANEVTIVIGKIMISSSKGVGPEYLEKCKRMYCLRTKGA